jgi:hypothetical protein
MLDSPPVPGFPPIPDWWDEPHDPTTDRHRQPPSSQLVESRTPNRSARQKTSPISTELFCAAPYSCGGASRSPWTPRGGSRLVSVAA